MVGPQPVPLCCEPRSGSLAHGDGPAGVAGAVEGDHVVTVLGRPLGQGLGGLGAVEIDQDRKSTRLNSSHVAISYAVFCLKKKTTENNTAETSIRLIIHLNTYK